MSIRSKPIYGANNNVQDSVQIKNLYDALDMLRKRGKSGVFYLAASYFSPSSASATLNAIKAGRRKVPEGEFEYKVNVRKDIGRSYLYARRIK